MMHPEFFQGRPEEQFKFTEKGSVIKRYRDLLNWRITGVGPLLQAKLAMSNLPFVVKEDNDFDFELTRDQVSLISHLLFVSSRVAPERRNYDQASMDRTLMWRLNISFESLGGRRVVGFSELINYYKRIEGEEKTT